MKNCLSCMFGLAVIVITLSGLFIWYQYKGCYFTIDKVVGTEVLKYDAGDKYIVHGNNDDYLVATDPFNSVMKPQELLDGLKSGKTYRFRTCGWRIPLINFYKIIVNYQENTY